MSYIWWIKGRIMCKWLKCFGNWKWIGKSYKNIFCKFFQFTLLLVNHVLWVNSIANIKSQLQTAKVNWNSHKSIEPLMFILVEDACNSLMRFPIDFRWLQFSLLKAHDSLEVKWIGKIYKNIFVTFSNSLSVSKTL